MYVPNVYKFIYCSREETLTHTHTHTDQSIVGNEPKQLR